MDVSPGSLRSEVFDACVYHADCPDGFGAAWAVRAAKGDGVRFVPGRSGRPVVSGDWRGLRVLLVDFCWDRAATGRVLEEAASVVVLDHHLTAEADVGPMRHPKLRTFFDASRSGAALAWSAFHESSPPALIRHIEDYDLFRRVLPGTDEIQLALASHPFDFEVWDDLDVEALRAEGGAILRWTDRQIGRIAASSGRMVLAGLDVPCANAPRCFVDRLGHRLAKDEPFAVVWAESSGFLHFSLRSREGSGLAVNAIAEGFGGRGHRHAAVFSLPRDGPQALALLASTSATAPGKDESQGRRPQP